MPLVHDDVDAICHRLTDALRAIEERMSLSAAMPEGLEPRVGLAETAATPMAAERARLMAHFPLRGGASASAAA
jgi:hypothetical protein